MLELDRTALFNPIMEEMMTTGILFLKYDPDAENVPTFKDKAVISVAEPELQWAISVYVIYRRNEARCKTNHSIFRLFCSDSNITITFSFTAIELGGAEDAGGNEDDGGERRRSEHGKHEDSILIP